MCTLWDGTPSHLASPAFVCPLRTLLQAHATQGRRGDGVREGEGEGRREGRKGVREGEGEGGRKGRKEGEMGKEGERGGREKEGKERERGGRERG